MSDSGVLIDLAEHVLTVDELHGPAPQCFERQTSAVEFLVLALGNPSDDFGLRKVTEACKALADTVLSARSGHHKLHLAELQRGRVVQIRHELVRKKWTKRWHVQKNAER